MQRGLSAELTGVLYSPENDNPSVFCLRQNLIRASLELQECAGRSKVEEIAYLSFAEKEREAKSARDGAS